MSVRMYDSVTANAIPTDAAIVGGYVDGRYAWSAADWGRFPNSVKVTIVVNPRNNAGDVYDCEPGNGTPADAGPWVAMRQAAGHPYPVVYCDKSHYEAVRGSVAAHANLGACGFWVAEWTGLPHMIQGAIAVQYADPIRIRSGDPAKGRNVDLSEVYSGPWINAAPANGTDAGPRELRLTSPYMSGDDVRAVQEHVGAPIDGIYGPNTVVFVERWQRDHGLTVDGIVGPQTRSSLDHNPPWSAPVSVVPPFPGYVQYGTGMPPHPPSEAVKQVQRALSVRGYFAAADGECGPATVTEIKRFQHDHGLATDGIAGPLTWRALFS